MTLSAATGEPNTPQFNSEWGNSRWRNWQWCNPRRTMRFSAICIALIAASCSTSEPSAAVVESPGGSGSVEQLCATAIQWQPTIVAAGTDLGPLAEAKIGYLNAAQAVAPASWQDNIGEILPVWQTLRDALIAADGDASRIDVQKIQVDFADSTANEIALETFVQARCGG